MIEHAPQQRTKAEGADTTLGPSPMAMCPMAKMCAGMMKNPSTGYLAMVAGMLLIIVGAVIFIEPRILVWLASASLVFTGVMFLMTARFIRGLRARGTL